MSTEKRKLTLITGNSSGDLDSLISSYVLGALQPMNSCQGGKTKVLFHFPSDEWRLHPEAALLFNRCGSELENTLFLDELDDLNLKLMNLENKLNIILIDHNYPEMALREFNSITEIIDHHQILIPLDKSINCTIHNTGSCSTLVAEKLFSRLDKSENSISNSLKTELANLLYFTIRIDTDLLENGGQYDLKRDQTALEKLKNLISLDPSFLEELKTEKMNFSNFSMEDYLCKDYKSWKWENISYGISTVHISVDSFSRELLQIKKINSFMKKKNIEILFMMHSLKRPILIRELSVFFSGKDIPNRGFLQNLKCSELFTEMTDVPIEGNNIYFFSQLEPKLSRKKIQPYLEQLMKRQKE